MIYSKTFRDYNQLPRTMGKGIVQPILKGIGLLTDFNPPVNYYYDHRKEYASLIYFTDGEAPLPTKNPQGVIWVISSIGTCYQDFPGKVVRIPRQQSNDE